MSSEATERDPPASHSVHARPPPRVLPVGNAKNSLGGRSGIRLAGGNAPRMQRRHCLATLLAFPAALLPGAVHAAVPGALSAEQDAPSPEKAERYRVKKPGARLEAGAARVGVSAPPELVRAVLTDYRHYSKLSSRFERARVVGKKGKQTDVYLQVPILKGSAKIWVVLRFDPPRRVDDDEEVIEARMVKGNVKRMEALWRIRRAEEGRTALHLEMLIDPDLPFPATLVTAEVARAADISVTGARRRAEERWSEQKSRR